MNVSYTFACLSTAQRFAADLRRDGIFTAEWITAKGGVGFCVAIPLNYARSIAYAATVVGRAEDHYRACLRQFWLQESHRPVRRATSVLFDFGRRRA